METHDTYIHETHTTEPVTPATEPKKASGSAAVEALAIIGFIALLILGIMLALYGARFIPGAVSKIVHTSSTIGSPSDSDNATSTQPSYLHVTSTTALQPSAATTTVTLPSSPQHWSAPVTEPSQPIVTHHESTGYKAPYGNPDLATTILATGYLTGESTDTFVPAQLIPPGARPAVKFIIANKGTNATGPWNFLAKIPTVTGTVFTSPTEVSMNPGDHVVFTLGFNQAFPGPAQTITVVADPTNVIYESNEGNNSAAAAVTITQTGN
jgi:hypothetical protein